MSDNEQEYEVESIVQARVERGKGRKLVWKYCVKWKGYSDKDNTWEPLQSFGSGAESFIERFWERAHTSGRDPKDLGSFQVGEEFYPVGPPRRKQKLKSVPSQDAGSAPPPVSETSSKRRRSSFSGTPLDTDGPPRKRQDRESEFQKTAGRTPVRGKRAPRKSSDGEKRKVHHREPSQSRDPSALFQPTRKGSSLFGDDSEDEIMRRYLIEPSDSVPPNGEDMSETPGNSLVDSSLQLKATEQSSNALTSQSLDLGDDLNFPGLFTENAIGTEVVQLGPPSTTTSTSGAPVVPPPIKPFHRVRAVNPLVKMADDIEYRGMEGAISVKARVLRNAPGVSSSIISQKDKMVEPSRARTSLDSNLTSQKSRKKNTSSLLTFQKGSLKTVKGKYSSLSGEQEGGEHSGAQWPLPADVSGSQRPSVDVQGDSDGDAIPGLHGVEDAPSLTSQRAGSAPPPQSAPTGQELLQLAGLDQQVADSLPDFEDPPTESSNAQTNQLTCESLHQQRLELAKESLFPAALSPASDAVGPSWRSSTIFGPLGLGTDMSIPVATEPSQSTTESTRTPFFLCLDSSVFAPVVLKDVSTFGSPSLNSIVFTPFKGPPGKFYKAQHALSLLDTLRTGGSSGRVVPDPQIDEAQQRHFDRFRCRLESGELFIAMAGIELLAFCSSQDADLSRRLNVPPVLVGLPSTVLVSRVKIENYSAYAEAASKADYLRW